MYAVYRDYMGSSHKALNTLYSYNNYGLYY